MNRASPKSGRRRASSVLTGRAEPLQEVEGDGPAQSLQPQPTLSKKWKETGQLSPYRRNRASPRIGRRRASSVPTAPTEPLQEVEGDGPAQSLQAEPSLSKKWKETGQLSPYSPKPSLSKRWKGTGQLSPNRRTEPLLEVEGDGPAQSLQAEPSFSKKWKETGHLSPNRRTEPLLEVEGDGPAQSLQAEPRISKKWKETGQLSPYRRNRASPRSGRRRASSVPTAPPSLSKKWKEMGQLSPYRRNRASPRSGRRRASSVPTATTEPLQEVEGDGPAQSLQAEPNLSKKSKETGQLSPNVRNRTSPRSGRRRASSVLTGGAEKLQEVEGDGPAQSLQPQPSLSKKWKETGQLSPYRRNRASPRSEGRRASSVPTATTEPLQEVEGDGPAQSLQPQPSLSKKWKETGQLSPYSPKPSLSKRWKGTGQLSPNRRTEPLLEVEGDGPAQSLQAEPSFSKKWKETGHLSRNRRTEPLLEVEGDGPAQSLQSEPRISKKWKETGQLSPYRRNRASPRSGRRRASSVLTGGAEKLQEVEGDGPAQSLQPQPSLSKKWKETGQLSPYRRNRASPRSGRRRASSVPTATTEPLQEVEGDGPAQSLQAEPSLSQKWKETGQLSPYRRSRESTRSVMRRASSILTGGTETLQEVEGDGPAQSLQPQPSLSKKWKETGQLSPYSPNRASPRSGRRRASSVLTGGTEPLQ